VPIVRLLVKKYWYAAASVLLIAGLSATLYFNLPVGKSNESLFRQYYSANDLIDVTRTGDATIVEAAIKFQERNYVLSSELFRSILDKDQKNMACWFYYGISSIETGNLKEAEKAFTVIINDNQSLYVEQAEWYLALNFIKSNKLDKASELLKSISANPENKHQKDAARLLEKLN
jgi:tetratricopeptide (TPR) repeat protein